MSWKMYMAVLGGVVFVNLSFAQLPLWYHSQKPRQGPGGWAAFGEPGNPPFPNHWCSDAALQMVFDFFEGNVKANPNLPRYPQHEIMAVANTNDWQGVGAWNGTVVSDLRRSAHFSSQSSVNIPPNDTLLAQYWNGTGYSWRTVINGVKPGYSACEDNWKQQGWNFMQLIALIYGVPYNPGFPDSLEKIPDSTALMYPIILFLNIDSMSKYLGSEIYLIDYPDTIDSLPRDTEGHAVVFYQYWFSQKWVFILDPTLGLWRCTRNFFWNNLWDGEFLFAAPWQFVVSQGPPVQVKVKSQFNVTVGPTYTGPPPLNNLPNQPRYPLNQSSATISLPPGLSLPNNDPTHNIFQWLNSLSDNQNGANLTTWNVNANQVGNYTITVSSEGTLQPLNSQSYNNYSDVIGFLKTTYNVAVISDTIIVIVEPCLNWYDPPYWTWICSWDLHQDTLMLCAKNPGNYPATNILVHILISNPTTVLSINDPNWLPYKDTLIPLIAPGDSSIVPVPLPGNPNSYGQPYWSFIAWVDDWPGDTLISPWLFEEDGGISSKNLLLTHEIVPGEPIYFRISNPDTLPLIVINGVDPMGLPPGWDYVITPDSILLSPNESFDCTLLINPPNPIPPQDSIAYIHVTSTYFNTDPVFYRFGGGFTWFYKKLPPVKTNETPAVLKNGEVTIHGNSVTMRFSKDYMVEISVYNIIGRKILTTGKKYYGIGHFTWDWNYKDLKGQIVPSGIYYLLVKYGSKSTSSQILFLR